MGKFILNKQTRRRTITVLAVSGLLCAALISASADEPSVLNPSDQPPSPQYQSLFPEGVLPLDSRLSWTKRFTGNENFNADEVLGNITSVSLQPATLPEQLGNKPASASEMDAAGVVKSVNQSQGKIKIAHGPIDKYGMPAMTMVFKVETPDLLAEIEKGQQISFDIDNSSGGFIVTRLMPTAAIEPVTAGKSMDARGVVRAVRMSQGKVKIEHGPIEKYGMPGMTMMFKVENPELLQGIDKDALVEFDIDNSSGGFVITDITPAKAQGGDHVSE
jgi:Cu/Ag efflux protein CusF